MADLRCPNCYDNLGKQGENPVNAWCGTCGTDVPNPGGYSCNGAHDFRYNQELDVLECQDCPATRLAT